MNQQAQFGVILPAAGTGTRFGQTGGDGDKLLVDIGGQSVLQRSVGLFANRSDVAMILIVTAPERFDVYREHLAESGVAGIRLAFTAGGRERWESVLFGLRHLAGTGGGGVGNAEVPEFVAIHDAARPLCPPAVVEEAFHAAREKGGAVPCVPEPATLKKRAADGAVAETIDRRGLYQAQTPQCFGLRQLLEGYEELLARGRIADLTDDAQVFERMGWPVAITAGAAANIKITTGADIALARALLAAHVI